MAKISCKTVVLLWNLNVRWLCLLFLEMKLEVEDSATLMMMMVARFHNWTRRECGK
jgi:hypothetical protein